jgi:3',5'-cyclic AMP phosphodiesterase CpdA
MVRLAHVSDIHVTARPLGWGLRDYFNKRMTSWVNLRVARRKRFVHNDRILAALAIELRERGVEHVVFSGDATSLGLEAEVQQAAELLGVGRGPGLAVPGNHDYLTRHTECSGDFERHFAPWQEGLRIGAEIYPFAQQVGHLWLIGLNSARGNRWFWDASGYVGAAQLVRLKRLLKELPPGPRVLVTHYPICRNDGRPETVGHGLVDLAAVVEVAAAGGVCLWLHGHRHGFYYLQTPSFAPFPIICAGSTTQIGCSSYGDYTIDDTELRGLRRVYDPTAGAYRDAESFT